MTKLDIKIPFSYFGSKRRVAPIIWQGLGNVSNYIEPFCGSLSILLSNPNPAKIETVNDKDNLLCNFWRAVSNEPQEVAKHADYPVIETDLHVRHKWLLSSLTEEFKYKIENDHEFYDTKIAGIWVWGMAASIGDNWLKPKGLNAAPMLSSAGGGIHGLTYDVYKDFDKLKERLKRVRVCCGDWKRIVTPSITYNNKGIGQKDITGIALDSPYELKGRDKVYSQDSNIFKEVYQWAIDNGNNPRLRIVLCGYEGDYSIPDTWQTFSWKSSGMGNMGDDRGRNNSFKERIYFSPHCLKVHNE